MTRKPIKQKLTETEEKNLFFFSFLKKCKYWLKRWTENGIKITRVKDPNSQKKRIYFVGIKFWWKKNIFTKNTDSRWKKKPIKNPTNKRWILICGFFVSDENGQKKKKIFDEYEIDFSMEQNKITDKAWGQKFQFFHYSVCVCVYVNVFTNTMTIIKQTNKIK